MERDNKLTRGGVGTPGTFCKSDWFVPRRPLEVMDIGIDLRVLAGGSYGGIAQYLLCLLPELFSAADRSAYGGKIKFKLFFNAYQKKLFDYPWLENENVQLIHLNYPNRLLFASSKLFEYPKLDNLIRGADVFFSP